MYKNVRLSIKNKSREFGVLYPNTKFILNPTLVNKVINSFTELYVKQAIFYSSF